MSVAHQILTRAPSAEANTANTEKTAVFGPENLSRATHRVSQAIAMSPEYLSSKGELGPEHAQQIASALKLPDGNYTITNVQREGGSSLLFPLNPFKGSQKLSLCLAACGPDGEPKKEICKIDYDGAHARATITPVPPKSLKFAA